MFFFYQIIFLTLRIKSSQWISEKKILNTNNKILAYIKNNIIPIHIYSIFHLLERGKNLLAIRNNILMAFNFRYIKYSAFFVFCIHIFCAVSVL